MSEQTTHVATTQQRPPTSIEVFRKNLEGEFLNTVQNYYQGREAEAMIFKTAAVDYVRKVPKLLEVNRMSLLSALVQAAQFRLLPSGVGGEAFIIPYGNEAKFQLGYQGIISLLYRAEVKSVKALIVYDNEIFEYEEGLTTTLRHIPTKFGEKKGEPVGVYAVAATSNGGHVFKVMSEADIMAIKNMSKAKDKKDSPWNTGDPELWMWKKTCLIQLAKLLPKSVDLQRAIAADYEAEDRAPLDPGGIGVGRSFHDPEALQDAAGAEDQRVPEKEKVIDEETGMEVPD